MFNDPIEEFLSWELIPRLRLSFRLADGSKPDFVGSLSVNRRYHYPARAFTPFRAAFIQIDPLVANLNASSQSRLRRQLPLYLISWNSPALRVDPRGLDVDVNDCVRAMGEVFKEFSEQFPFLEVTCSPTFVCTCDCDGLKGHKPPTDGAPAVTHPRKHFWNSPEIIVCTERVNRQGGGVGVGYFQLKEVVRHEWVHAADDCNSNLGGGCENRLCAEARALSYSGECSKGGLRRMGGMYKDRDECIESVLTLYTADYDCPLKLAAIMAKKCAVPEHATKLPAFPGK
jgi:hypothetical protein